MTVEEKVYEVFKKVLDVSRDEIKPDEPLNGSLGVDSTELVEITVGIKKELNIPLESNEVTKTNTFNEIIDIVKTKGAS